MTNFMEIRLFTSSSSIGISRNPPNAPFHKGGARGDFCGPPIMEGEFAITGGEYEG
jgi:hypothetical protein